MDPIYREKPKRVWLDVTNIGVEREGMVRVVLSVNGIERELYHSYVTDGVVAHGYNLTWLLPNPWYRKLWQRYLAWRNGWLR